MKLLLFAQTSEAQATIEQLNATADPASARTVWTEGVVPTRYTFDDGIIVITNIGLYSAAAAVAKYAPACDEIWNIGMAGALGEGLEIASLVPIQEVGKYVPLNGDELDRFSLYCVNDALPPLTLHEHGHRLVSSDFPIHEQTHRDRLAENYHLVDMEGYAIAYLARELGKKCHMWKIVSDFASPGGRELIRKNKRKLSERMAEHLIESCITT